LKGREFVKVSRRKKGRDPKRIIPTPCGKKKGEGKGGGAEIIPPEEKGSI